MAVVTQPFDRSATCTAPGNPDESLGEFWEDDPWEIAFKHNLSAYETNKTYLNLAGKGFIDISEVTGADVDGDSRSAVAFDFDSDGDLDIALRQVGGGPLKVFRNEFTSANYLDISLNGIKSNALGIGARVTIHVDDKVISRDMYPVNTFHSQAASRIHFGLGQKHVVEKLVVDWPSGETQTLTDITANQHLLVTEGFAETIPVIPGKLMTRPGEPHHTMSTLTGGPPPSKLGYTGTKACIACHEDIHNDHSLSAHAKTFSASSDSPATKSYCGAEVDAGADRGKFNYVCDAEGLAVGIPEKFGGRLFPLDYAVGSGKHAVTYVTLLPEGGQTISVEHRMTWFPEGEQLRLTPGQSNAAPKSHVEHFGKVFRGKDMRRCISCHVTTGHIQKAQLTNLTAGIHCERCHGPGAEHVRSANAGDTETAINSIRSNWSAFAEVAMCGNCHRMPYDVSPERLASYPKSLVRFQPIGLLQSRCYKQANGELSCTTCHNPHQDITTGQAANRITSCVNCHSTPQQTHCAAGKTDSCISCHMPKLELVEGVSFHDHWIRVPGEGPKSGSTNKASAGHTSLNTE